MRTPSYGVIALAALVASVAAADQIVESVDGACPGPQPVSFRLTIDFTATGGDFNAGTGTGTVMFTVENTSGLYPFQSEPIGNPVLTGFFFNLPPGTGAGLVESRILAGSTINSSGTVVDGVPVPAGCTVLGMDLVSPWYRLVGSSATGQYGIFTNGLTTLEGVKAGLVDPEVFVGCVAQGPVYSPLVVAGLVKFTLDLTNLSTALDSARDFQTLCTSRPEVPRAFWLAGKFQATGIDGEDSCFIGEPCGPVAAEWRHWGAVKNLYRD